jgi:hypothetical protein
LPLPTGQFLPTGEPAPQLRMIALLKRSMNSAAIP